MRSLQHVLFKNACWTAQPCKKKYNWKVIIYRLYISPESNIPSNGLFKLLFNVSYISRPPKLWCKLAWKSRDPIRPLFWAGHFSCNMGWLGQIVHLEYLHSHILTQVHYWEGNLNPTSIFPTETKFYIMFCLKLILFRPALIESSTISK